MPVVEAVMGYLNLASGTAHRNAAIAAGNQAGTVLQSGQLRSLA
jgi:hypothetical protein